MGQITDLLDDIDRLDQEATEGPWNHQEDNVMGDPYVENGYTKIPYIAQVVRNENDAPFIALSRTALPALSRAVRAVLELHKPEIRWTHDGIPEHSFDSVQQLADYLGEEPEDGVEAFQLCTECKRVEEGAEGDNVDDVGYETSIYPCPTVQAITDALGADHE